MSFCRTLLFAACVGLAMASTVSAVYSDSELPSVSRVNCIAENLCWCRDATMPSLPTGTCVRNATMCHAECAPCNEENIVPGYFYKYNETGSLVLYTTIPQSRPSDYTVIKPDGEHLAHWVVTESSTLVDGLAPAPEECVRSDCNDFVDCSSCTSSTLESDFCYWTPRFGCISEMHFDFITYPEVSGTLIAEAASCPAVRRRA